MSMSEFRRRPRDGANLETRFLNGLAGRLTLVACTDYSPVVQLNRYDLGPPVIIDPRAMTCNPAASNGVVSQGGSTVDAGVDSGAQRFLLGRRALGVSDGIEPAS
jgi:hypothetical protein